MIDALGGDVDRIFGEVRVDIGLLNSPFNELSLAQYCRLFEEAARQTGYDNFGLRFGHGFTPRQLGPLGYMAVNSPTMAAGLRALVDYMPAHQQNTTMALRQERDLFYLDYQITDGRISRRRQDAELSLGMFCNIFYHCHGKQWTPLEIHFEHPRPLEGREHETLFGAPVFFAQPTNSIVFRQRDLDAPMPEPDSYLFSLLEPFMRGRQRRACSDDLVGVVRQKIELHFNTGDPSIKKIAAELGMQLDAPPPLARSQCQVPRSRARRAARTGPALRGGAAHRAHRGRVPAGLFGAQRLQPRVPPVDGDVARALSPTPRGTTRPACSNPADPGRYISSSAI